MENSSTSVIVKLELGHQAFLRSHPTQDGFTHDWTVFVRGIEGSNIHHFIEKVVFYLHESFPKPKRVVKEPPYQVSESGYAGFIMPIEVYFRNKEEPKKVKFEYDLYLRLEGPPVNHVRYEKLTFQNPVDDFRRKLLKAGGNVHSDKMAVQKVSVVANILKTLIDDDGDEILLLYNQYSKNITKDIITTAVSSITNRSKKIIRKSFVSNIIPRYSMDDFRSHFRLSRSVVNMIIQKFTKANYNKRGRPNINSSTVVLLGLWTLGNQETFWQISDQFDVSQSSCHSLFRYFCKMLVNWIPVYIQWLKPDKFKDTAEKFEKIADFPGFIGAIDGCHINIKKPSVDGESYFNRKKAYSIVLMATVDNSMTFTDINIGWPSSVHDARVFRNSDLYKNLNENNFPNNYHLIEDAAFPLLPTLLVPYRDNGHLTPKQIHFNKALSKTRIIVERAFGLLKGKFRCLKYLDINCMENIKYIVNAACVLHNIYIGTKDWMEEEIELDLTDIDLQEDNSSKPFGTDKRNYIADMLM